MKRDTQKLDSNTKLLIEVASASVSLVIGSFIKSPIERVKLILQNQDASIQIKDGNKYRGIVDVVGRVYREQGFLSFYRGNLCFLILKSLPTKYLIFPTRNILMKKLDLNKYRNQYYKFFAANLVLGGTLGSVNLFMTYPLQTIRVRLALDLGRTTEERQFKNIRDCFKKIYQSDKFVGLYRGCFCSILGIFVYRGLYFGLFDAAKFLTFTDNNFLYNFLIAQATTLTAGILSYPFNTICDKYSSFTYVHYFS